MADYFPSNRLEALTLRRNAPPAGLEIQILKKRSCLNHRMSELA
nr:MAG TPA: hypothetical protein [Caudoviricetes sp.]